MPRKATPAAQAAVPVEAEAPAAQAEVPAAAPTAARRKRSSSAAAAAGSSSPRKRSSDDRGGGQRKRAAAALPPTPSCVGSERLEGESTTPVPAFQGPPSDPTQTPLASTFEGDTGGTQAGTPAAAAAAEAAVPALDPAAVLTFHADNGGRRDVKAADVIAISAGRSMPDPRDKERKIKLSVVHVLRSNGTAVSAIESVTPLDTLLARMAELGRTDVPERVPREAHTEAAAVKRTATSTGASGGAARKGTRGSGMVSPQKMAEFVTAQLKANPTMTQTHLIHAARAAGMKCTREAIIEAVKLAGVTPHRGRAVGVRTAAPAAVPPPVEPEAPAAAAPAAKRAPAAKTAKKKAPTKRAAGKLGVVTEDGKVLPRKRTR